VAAMVEFEWDEDKRQINLWKHGLDFEEVEQIFDGRPQHTKPSKNAGESRSVTTAIVDDRFVTVVWTERGEKYRVISLRRARDAEKRQYRALHGGGVEDQA
jgi:uncharacterized DUF497 family protein